MKSMWVGDSYLYYNVMVKGEHVYLPNGQKILLEEVVNHYFERLHEENSKEEVPKRVITAELKPGEWFFIDRDVIEKNEEKICRVCGEERDSEGRLYRERFKESNEIADREPERYPRRLWTFVFKCEWEYKKEQEMRDMCKKKGDGMCDEVICDFELQMRICNGESADDLFKKPDKLPCIRVIQLRDGETGYFGGGANYNDNYPPAELFRDYFEPDCENYENTPYAYRGD